jgi:hypothetical protein
MECENCGATAHDMTVESNLCVPSGWGERPTLDRRLSVAYGQGDLSSILFVDECCGSCPLTQIDSKVRQSLDDEIATVESPPRGIHRLVRSSFVSQTMMG